MPAAFDYCHKQRGSIIRSKRLNKSEYMRICILNGKSYAGEIKKYKRLKLTRRKNG
jgi:hypothetical protein